MGRQLFRRVTRIWAGALLASGALPCVVAAQTIGDRAAWDALILSPIGALAPLARDPVDDEARQANVWLRYGRWRYDGNDAVHNNTGINRNRDISISILDFRFRKVKYNAVV